MHIYTLCPSLLQSFRKFCWAVSEELRWPTVSVVSFIFVKFLSSKRGIAPRKKIESKCSVDMHIHTLCPSLLKVSRNSVEWFQRICANKKNSSIFHFGQISKFKKGVTPRKKMESKFPVDMHIYTLYMSFITTKFQEILLSGFRGVALTRMKERVSKLTYPTLQHCLRMLYIMNGNSKWQAIGQKRGYKLLLKRINQHFL